MEIRITWTKLDQSAVLEDYFKRKIEHLEHYVKPILAAELELAHESSHHKKGKFYRAEARLALAKKTIYAKEVAEHPFEAIDLLMNHLRSQIDDYRDKNKIEHSKRRNLRDKLRLKGLA
ncbi:MAG: ribosome-associated translation inhibitor RaiA [Parcubacteria group bacterium]